jgi:hypothetical protein
VKIGRRALRIGSCAISFYAPDEKLQLVAAHGGIERWRAAPSIRIDGEQVWSSNWNRGNPSA